jgi:hypothetical protein
VSHTALALANRREQAGYIIYRDMYVCGQTLAFLNQSTTDWHGDCEAERKALVDAQ